jgi:HD-GYP domain-containing protein (c-di-GMP phosphodiesterase class II)
MPNVIPLDQLKPGMFVTKIDVPWIRSPFLLHQRLIRDIADINALRSAGVTEVWIDPSKSQLPGSASVGTGTEPAQATPPAVRNSIKIERELGAAQRIRQNVIKALETTFAALETGTAPNMAVLMPLIDDTLGSLLRNDQALMTLMHIQRTAKILVQHSFGTFALVLALAIEMNLSDEEKRELGLAALLHDAGWLQLPMNLFAKRHPYTGAEESLVREHVALTAKMVAPVDTLSARTRDTILQHHERGNGSGFPAGLKDTAIDTLTRILAVADQYDSLVHGLMDNPGLSAKGALGKMFQQAQLGLFDRDIVTHLIHLLGIYPVGSALMLNTGEKALVIESHRDVHSQPTVAIYYNQRGIASLEPVVVDLRHQRPQQAFREVTAVLDVRVSGADPARLLTLESILG